MDVAKKETKVTIGAEFLRWLAIHEEKLGIFN